MFIAITVFFREGFVEMPEASVTFWLNADTDYFPVSYRPFKKKMWLRPLSRNVVQWQEGHLKAADNEKLNKINANMEKHILFIRIAPEWLNLSSSCVMSSISRSCCVVTELKTPFIYFPQTIQLKLKKNKSRQADLESCRHGIFVRQLATIENVNKKTQNLPWDFKLSLISP